MKGQPIFPKFAARSLTAFVLASMLAGASFGGDAIAELRRPLEERSRLLALFQEKGEEAAPQLADSLEHESPLVRRTAAHLLVRIGKPALEGIEQALEHPDFRVRRIAIRGLAEMGEIMPYWERIRDDEHPSIEQEVRALIFPAVTQQALEERLARARARLAEAPVLQFDGERSTVLAERAMGEDFAIGESDFTYEAWFRPDSAEGTQGVIGQGRGDSTERPGVNIRFDNGIIRFRAANRRGRVAGWPAQLNYPVEATGRWTHVAVTVDRESQAILYVDGMAVGWGDASAAGDDDGFDTGRLVVGRRPYTAIWHFHGAIAEVRIWTAARTAEQIQETLDRQLTGEEEDLLLYWPMDEGEGDKVFDKSKSENHGQIRAASWE